MQLSKLNIIALLIGVALLALAWIYADRLPDPVPIHWNASGEVDGYMAKPWGVFLLPLFSLGMTVLLLVVPLLSPHGFRLESAKRVYDIIILVLAIFFAFIAILSYTSILNPNFEMLRILPGGIGLLFIILGNYLAKFPKNFFVGIRTPWTLASDEVWLRTHRLGGKLMMLTGVFAILSAIFNWPLQWFIGVAVVQAIFTVLYSLLLYRKIHGFNPEQTD